MKRCIAYIVLILIISGTVWAFGDSDLFPSKIRNIYTQCATIKDTTTEDDFPALFYFSVPVTIQAWRCIQAGAELVIGGVDLCDGNATNCNALSNDGNCTSAQLTVSDLNDYKAIPAGQFVGWHTTVVSGDNSWTTVCIDYVMD